MARADSNRGGARRAIAALVLGLGAAGGGAATFPPHESLSVDLAAVAPGAPARLAWGGLPVWVVRRTPGELARLAATAPEGLGAPRGRQWAGSLIYAAELHPRLPAVLALDQPALEATALRAKRPEFLVVVAFSPYDGCDLELDPARAAPPPAPAPLAAFRNPCGGERYDLAGRVLRGHRFEGQWNLYIPPHTYPDEHTLVIGLGDPPRALPELDLAVRVDYPALAPPERLLEGARRGRLDVVRAALAFGAAPDARDREGNTALILAALKGHAAVAAALLDAGADPEAANHAGVSPLYAAILGEDPAGVALLAARGADPRRRCAVRPCRGTPLNTALAWIRDPARAAAVVRALLAAGADPRQAGGGRDAFDWALQGFHEELLPVLRAPPRGATRPDRGAQE